MLPRSAIMPPPRIAPMMPKMIEMMITAGIDENAHLMMIATMRQNGMSISTTAIACGAAGGSTDIGGPPGCARAHGWPKCCNSQWGSLMRIVDLNTAPREEWRKGVLTRMRVTAANGGTQLCLFEQWCEVGHGAPTHLHAVEEVLHVLQGEADVWVGERQATLTSGQLMIVPAGVKHGFSNCGTSELHIQSTLAAPVFEAAYDDKRETPRRWLPG